MKYFNDGDRVVECIPNFSEGRDRAVIDRIADAIGSMAGAHVLHKHMGFDANRTVITIAAEADAIVEAAFRGIETAARLIDMREHSGAHPRMGATDVCPLVPLRNITMEETVALSAALGQRVWEELRIPVYLYGYSARRPQRRNLANIRKGEYESIPEKMRDVKWMPDIGEAVFNARSGMTAIGARDFLVAFNVSLNTEDVSVARTIAGRLRESGHYLNGHRLPGRIKGLKAIGWRMPSYHCSQVSMNITDIDSAPIEIVFEAVKEEAGALGYEVLGSELVGLIPERVLVKAGLHYSSPTIRNADNNYLIDLSVNKLGLGYLSEFKSEERILERLL